MCTGTHLTSLPQAQLNSLAPLKVPRQLLVKQRAQSSEGVEPEEQSGGSESIKNQTDHEKTVVKRTASLIEVSVYAIKVVEFNITL